MTAHFVARAAERGYEGDPQELCDAIYKALKTRRDELERVCETDDGGVIYRFHAENGQIVFPLVKGGRPVTLFTHRMVIGKKFARKMKKRPRRGRKF